MDIPGLGDTRTVGGSKENKKTKTHTNMQDKRVIKALQH